MKKKNLFYFLATVLLSATTMMGLTACGDDDDDNGGGGGSSSTSAGVIDAKSGLRLKAAGNYTYYYDNDGRLDYIKDKYGKWSFSYNPNQISFIEDYQGNTSKEEVFNVSYNGKGYVSGMSATIEGESDSETWKTTGKATFSYDGSGHLTKFSGTSKEEGYDDGEKYTETWTDDITLTWKNNQLLKVALVEKGSENGVTWRYTETWNFTYNSNYENIFQQWAPSMTPAFDSDIDELLAFVGLLGNGPAMLPDGAEYEENWDDDGDTGSDDKSYNFSYAFNNDGSLKTTTIGSKRYNFSYDYTDTRAITDSQELPAKRVRSLLLHPLKRH